MRLVWLIGLTLASRGTHGVNEARAGDAARVYVGGLAEAGYHVAHGSKCGKVRRAIDVADAIRSCFAKIQEKSPYGRVTVGVSPAANSKPRRVPILVAATGPMGSKRTSWSRLRIKRDQFGLLVRETPRRECTLQLIKPLRETSLEMR